MFFFDVDPWRLNIGTSALDVDRTSVSVAPALLNVDRRAVNVSAASPDVEREMVVFDPFLLDVAHQVVKIGSFALIEGGKGAPHVSYSIDDLEELTGFTRYAIRHYVRQRIIPTTTPNGPNTRYTDLHLHRLLAVRTLMAEGMSPAGAGRQLDNASPERLLELAGVAPSKPTSVAPPAPLVPVAVEAHEPAPLPAPSRNVAIPYRAGLARAREVWEHIVICPGVELRVSVAADTEARRVAGEIEAAWGTRD